MEKSRSPEEEESILKEIERILFPAYQPEFTANGHDLYHIQRMLKIAEKIVKNKEINIFLLKIAIWFHNIDRTTFFNDQQRPKEEIVTDIIHVLGLSKKEIELIVDAVKKHNQLNYDSDSTLLIYLKDIDRLDMGAIGIFRLIAHFPNLPPYKDSDFQKHTRSTAEKDLKSMTHNLQRCLEWENMLRIPQAKIFGKPRFAFMRQFFKELKKELKEINIIS